MLILDVGLSSFSEKYPATDVFYVNQNPIMEGDSVVYPIVLCAAKLVGNDVVVSKCTANVSELIKCGYSLVTDNQRESVDDAILASINAI
jgi:hypothetical protein